MAIRRNFPILLARAREAMMIGFRQELREFGLTEQQWRVIRVLDEYHELETGQLAEQAFILAPSLSGVLNRMEQAGLIVRHRLAEDQRKIYVRLTPKSQAIAKELRGRFEHHYQYLEEQLGLETFETLTGILEQIIELGQKNKAPTGPR